MDQFNNYLLTIRINNKVIMFDIPKRLLFIIQKIKRSAY